MRKITEFAMVLLLIALSFGCSKKSQKLEVPSDTRDPSRMMVIDMALAKWYAGQACAADQLEFISSVEFAPIDNSRDPEDILRDQNNAIQHIANLKFLEKGSMEKFRLWYIYQIEAANNLRDALEAKQIVVSDELNYQAVLELQKHDVETLKKEIKEQGCEYSKRSK